MELTQYQDEFVPHEMSHRLGQYLVSYATEHHLVEVHFFKADDRISVYVTKSPGVSVADAHAVVEAAKGRFAADHPPSPPGTETPRVVWDGYGMNVSGSY